MPDSPDINVSRWQQATRFMFGLGGYFSPRLDDKFQAVVVLENDRTEQRLGRGERECWGRAVSGNATAAQTSQAGLLIPAGSNTLVTIDAIIVSSPNPLTSGIIIARQYGGPATNANGTPIGRDTRMGSSTVPAAIFVQTVNAVRLGTVAWATPNLIPYYNGPPIVMAPSETANVVIWVDANNVNLDVTVSFAWRERALESGFLS